MVNTPASVKANVYYKDQIVGTTPCEVTVSKTGIRKGQEKLILKADGYKEYEIVLQSKLRILPFIGNCCLTVSTFGIGGFSFILDGATRGMWEVISPVFGNLQKDNSSQENAKYLTKEDNVDSQEMSRIEVLKEHNVLTDEEYRNLKFQIIEKKYNYDNSKASELIKLEKLVKENSISKDEMTALKIKILNDKYSYNPSVADEISKYKVMFDNSVISNEDFKFKKKQLIN